MVPRAKKTKQTPTTPPTPAVTLPAGLAPGTLVLLLRCGHCPPSQASTIVCSGCGQPLVSPIDRPYDATASAALDWLALIHDKLHEQQAEATP